MSSPVLMTDTHVSKSDLLFLEEPTLTFHHQQAVEDPRDGLTLFGPLDKGKPFGIHIGVIGTQRGVEYFKDWSTRIQGRLVDSGDPIARPPFPGFETVFRIPWAVDPIVTINVTDQELARTVNLDDRHQRVHKTVSLFADKLLQSLRSEDNTPDLWFIVEPDVVYENCRPKSNVGAELRIKTANRLNPRYARRLKNAPSLFEEDNTAAIAYHYDVDFHNQLKARLLESRALTQVVRESTIAPLEGVPGVDRPKRNVADFQAAIAWNICTAGFYKAGGRPWKLDGIRDGVCYLGMVFKKDTTQADPRTACCAAQMFLDSGDGVVFRGAVGPWYTPDAGEFHLSRAAARQLATLALTAYEEKATRPPTELFVHGKVGFDDEEWRGFLDAVDTTKTTVVGVRIQEERDFRIYSPGTRPVLRGLAYLRNAGSALLFTRGYTPRLRTYVGREVPRPLRIDISRGDADIKIVLADILALTKLNYNTCLLADGVPVTLRFADSIGEILTAGPIPDETPLPFRHYI